MSKFKVGDVIEREFLGSPLVHKVIEVGEEHYVLVGNNGKFTVFIPYVNLYYKLKKPIQIVNV